MKFYRILILTLHGIAGWALCGMIIFVGRTMAAMDAVLIVHLIAVPVIFTLLSIVYSRFFHYTSPLRTAIFFTSLAIFLDAAVIAPFAEKSPAMFIDGFRAVIGTWIPFTLIFISSFFAGKLTRNTGR